MAAELGPKAPSGKRCKEIQGPLLFSAGGRKMQAWLGRGRTGNHGGKKAQKHLPLL